MRELASRFAEMTGLRVVPADIKAAARGVLGSILAVTAFVVLLDAVLFRERLLPAYVAFFTSPLLPRVWVLCAMAAIEEVKFRLLLMSALAGVYSLVRGKMTSPVAVAIIVVSQFANVGHLVMVDPLYASLRYWLVGCIWGWLYWRHGWLSALAGHALVHVMLDPVLLLVLGT